MRVTRIMCRRKKILVTLASLVGLVALGWAYVDYRREHETEQELVVLKARIQTITARGQPERLDPHGSFLPLVGALAQYQKVTGSLYRSQLVKDLGQPDSVAKRAGWQYLQYDYMDGSQKSSLVVDCDTSDRIRGFSLMDSR